MRRVWAIARKTVRQRGRGNVVFLVLVQPILFCVVWGLCVSLELTDARVVLYAPRGGAEPRAVARALAATGVLRVRSVPSLAALDAALSSGAAGLAVVMGRDDHLVIVDGTDATLATQGLRAAVGALQAGGPEPEIPVRVWYPSAARGSSLLLLGALCYNLVWLLSYPAASLMDERQRGALAGLALTPLGASELWLGTLLPYLGLALWGALSQLGLAVAVAGLPLRGDLGLAAVGLVTMAVVHANLGFGVAAVARTGAQRTLGQLVLVFLMLAVSGFLVPDVNLPAWLREVAEGVPLTHGLRFVRGVFLRGAGVAEVAGELRALAGFAVGTSVAAVLAARSLLRA